MPGATFRSVIDAASHISGPRFQPGSLKAYLVAALIVAGASLLRSLLGSWIEGLPYVVFFPAVIAAIFLCGSAAGLFGAVLSVMAAWLFLHPSQISYLPLLQTSLFGVGTVTVAAVVSVMRAAIAKVWRLHETLRVSEEKFRSLLESAPDATIIVDEQRRIILVNARTETLFGYPRGELRGKPLELLLLERDEETYAAELAAFRAGFDATPAGRVIDLHGVCKDGRVFPIELSFGLINTETGVLVSNAIRDITARRQIEASLADASKAKSEFLARMSHELRTPLNAIIGFSDLIRDAVIGPLDARYRAYGGDINDAGRHLLNTINDILDISKIEGGRFELRDEIVSIADSIEACHRIVAVMAKTANVLLSTDVPSTLPCIISDEIRFRQILLNVMSNAVKFTPAGGRVTVSASVETDGAVIVVEDTGIGMSAEDIAIALEPFRQIDGPLSRRFDGTGLGLPLAKGLVELQGGRLNIQSVPAKGTTVRIQLPAERIVTATVTATA